VGDYLSQKINLGGFSGSNKLDELLKNSGGLSTYYFSIFKKRSLNRQRNSQKKKI
jgi:hypothetical protein